MMRETEAIVWRNRRAHAIWISRRVDLARQNAAARTVA
jgi:hypothetical protein